MAGPAAGATARRWRQVLPWLGLLIGLWAVLPPYTGPELNTETRVEVADHVVPAVLMLAVSAALLVRARRGAPEGAFPLVAGLLVALCGLWMTATHLPLVNQARRGENQVSNLDAAWHTVPGLVVLALGVVWVVAYWSAGSDQPPAAERTQGG